MDVFVTPPASQTLAHGAFGALESLPVPIKNGILARQRLHKRADPSLCSLLTQGPQTLLFVRACPRPRFRLGLHVQVQQLLDDVVHHADQFLSVVTE